MIKVILIKTVKFEGILNTPDDSDIGFFNECDLKCPFKIKEKTMKFPFCPEKISPQEKVSEYMKEMKLINYTRNKNLTCD